MAPIARERGGAEGGRRQARSAHHGRDRLQRARARGRCPSAPTCWRRRSRPAASRRSARGSTASSPPTASRRCGTRRTGARTRRVVALLTTGEVEPAHARGRHRLPRLQRRRRPGEGAAARARLQPRRRRDPGRASTGASRCSPPTASAPRAGHQPAEGPERRCCRCSRCCASPATSSVARRAGAAGCASRSGSR